MSEAELHVIKQRMHQGKLSKARRGELAFPVPIGYVRRPSGEVVFDPDEEVQQVVALVFRKFEELGTVRGVLRYLVGNGVKLGIRVREGEVKGGLEWRRSNRATLQNMLNNPIYAGAYAYGRRRVDPRRKKPGRPGTGYVSRLAPSEEWYVLIRGRLPAYLSWDEYEENLARLASNRSRADAMGAPGRGISLLQGLLVCGRCGARMNVRYGKGKGREHHVYFCSRLAADYGGKACQNVSGPTLDGFVTQKVLEALKPAALELSLAAAEHVERERGELDRLWERRLERAAYEADHAGRHYRLLEPENRLVARRLAKDWEEKLLARQGLEEDYRRFRSESPKLLSETEREAIRRLSEDIPALWGARTTTNEDRKEIVRQVLERAVVEVEGRSERVGVRFEWAGGSATEGVLFRPVAKLEQLSYYPELRERVRELAARGFSARAVAERLNKEGYRTPRRREEFGARLVGDLMRRLGPTVRGGQPPKGQEDGPLEEDEWWLSELATEVEMPKVTLYGWIRRGRVRAWQHPECSGRWVVWADEGEVGRLRRLRALPENAPNRGRREE